MLSISSCGFFCSYTSGKEAENIRSLEDSHYCKLYDIYALCLFILRDSV